MASIWLVLALCADLTGHCYFSPESGLPSREACFRYGRKLQLERHLPMNDFRCVEVRGHHG